MAQVLHVGPTAEQMRIATLERLVAELTAKAERKVSCKISDKGALSVYGLGRFPVTLYRSQWEKLIAAIPAVEAFMIENIDKLSVKA